jgi:hypothetical protein
VLLLSRTAVLRALLPILVKHGPSVGAPSLIDMGEREMQAGDGRAIGGGRRDGEADSDLGRRLVELLASACMPPLCSSPPPVCEEALERALEGAHRTLCGLGAERRGWTSESESDGDHGREEGEGVHGGHDVKKRGSSVRNGKRVRDGAGGVVLERGNECAGLGPLQPLKKKACEREPVMSEDDTVADEMERGAVVEYEDEGMAQDVAAAAAGKASVSWEWEEGHCTKGREGGGGPWGWLS